MIKLLSLIWPILTGFYTLQFKDINGNNTSMSIFQNKKVLIVNIATNSNKVSQLSELQQLYQQYGDSVAIIAFPSNSFGNETRNDAEIKTLCQNVYGCTFKIATKNPVTGAGIQTIYNWLALSSENGTIDVVISKDFQKILIDKEGKIIGVFSSSVSPMDNSIISEIMGQ